MSVHVGIFGQAFSMPLCAGKFSV